MSEGKLISYEVVKTLDVYSDEAAQGYRLEILRTPNPKEPFSANCYEEATDDTGKSRWLKVDFPWLGAKTLEAATDDALGFLSDKMSRD